MSIAASSRNGRQPERSILDDADAAGESLARLSASGGAGASRVAEIPRRRAVLLFGRGRRADV